MSTVVIDCRFSGGTTGLARYTREIVMELLKLASEHEFCLIVRSEAEPWLRSFPSVRLIVADIPHYSLAEQRELPSIIRQSGADLLLSLHFNIPLRCPIPAIVTVHDFILHRYPNQASFFKQLAYKFLIGRSLAMAKNVIAVSNFTAREAAELYGVSIMRKTVTILEGVSPAVSPVSLAAQNVVRARFALERPFYLYVGNSKEHKNVQTLIDGFALAGIPDRELVLITGGKEAKTLRLKSGVRIVQCVSDNDLSALYSAAIACVTASLYEGFCLPPIEALACGCPVIASHRTVIPEIIGGRDGVVLVEPTVEAFAEALRHVPARPRPQRMREWSQTATETLALLDRVLAETGRADAPPAVG